MTRFNLTVSVLYEWKLKRCYKYSGVTARNRTTFLVARTIKVFFSSICRQNFPDLFYRENSAQSLKVQLRIQHMEVSIINKEQYKQKFGKVEADKKSKNKKCWYKDCGYCLKYRTKCFNCHTND